MSQSRSSRAKVLTNLLVLGATGVVVIGAKAALSANEYFPWYTRMFNLMKPNYPLKSKVAKGYESVEEVFKEHFDKGQEVGSSVVAYGEGVKLVEIYGGYSEFESKVPFDETTLCIAFSTSKFLGAIAINKLVEQGLLNLDEKVASYWPEFGRQNKEDVTIADLLRDEGGVPCFKDPQPTYEDLNDKEKLSDILANTKHMFDGEKKRAYHVFTRGWIVDEIMRRVDPKKRSMRQFLQEEIQPLIDIEFYVGLPDVKEVLNRRATWYNYPEFDRFLLRNLPECFLKLYSKAPSKISDVHMEKGSLLNQALSLPLSKQGAYEFNTKDFVISEIPSFNGFTNASSLAKVAAYMANKGNKPLNFTSGKGNLLTEDAFHRALSEPSKKYDHCLNRETILSKGGFPQFKFADIEQELQKLGYKGDIGYFYGYSGYGGGLVVFNYIHNFSFSYLMNAGYMGRVGEGRAHNLLKQTFITFLLSKPQPQLKNTSFPSYAAAVSSSPPLNELHDITQSEVLSMSGSEP